MNSLVPVSVADFAYDRAETVFDDTAEGLRCLRAPTAPEELTAFVEEHGCHLVLKGARTIIAAPDGGLYINPTGNPALASGGTGDVLTGLIGGFLTRGWPLISSAIGGVYLQGLAADLLAEEMGQTGIFAGELLDRIPHLMTLLGRGEWPLKSPPPHGDISPAL